MDLTAVGGSIDDFLAGRCGRAPAPGDVLAFSGTSPVDRFIQKATLSKISHVGILLQPAEGQPLSLLEATGLGVTVTPVADALARYRDDHTCFFLPLGEPIRAPLLPATLAAYYAQNAGNKYNYAGVAAVGLYDLENPLFHLLMEHLGPGLPIRDLRRRLPAERGRADAGPLPLGGGPAGGRSAGRGGRRRDPTVTGAGRDRRLR
ncbi:MAG: hypothetical protein ABUS79_10845 [Pseudomonadota bacterium]